MAEEGHEGLGTIYELGDGQAGSGTAITAIAVANGVATVTSTAHGLADGEVTTIADVLGTGGMAETVNRPHLVRVVDANDFVLGTKFPAGAAYTSGGTSTIQNGAWTIIPGARTSSFESQADEIDVTSIYAPDRYRSYKAGLKANQWTMDLNDLPEEVPQGVITGLLELFNSGLNAWLRMRYTQITPWVYRASFINMLNATDAVDMEGRLDLTAGGRFSGPRLVIQGT